MRTFNRCFQRALFASFIFMTAASLSLSGCQGIGASTRGLVSDGLYESPLDNFSLPLPPMGVGTKIQDENGDDYGMVSFLDDLGNLKRIDYRRAPPNSASVQADSAYRGFLHDYLLPDLFMPVSPGTEVLHEEFVNEGEQRAYFAVLRIPAGSTIGRVRFPAGSSLSNVQAFTPARVRFPAGSTSSELDWLDTTRALLIFSEGDFMYVLSHASGQFDRGDASSSAFGPPEEYGIGPLEEELQSVEEILQRFRSTIEFN